MARFQVGIVVIMGDDDGVAGVLSERDIVSAVGRKEINFEEDVVADFMTETVVTISQNESIHDAVLAMNENGIRHLVATEGNKPIGVLSIRDVLRVFARQILDVESEAKEELTMEFVKAMAA